MLSRTPAELARAVAGCLRAAAPSGSSTAARRRSGRGRRSKGATTIGSACGPGRRSKGATAAARRIGAAPDGGFTQDWGGEARPRGGSARLREGEDGSRAAEGRGAGERAGALNHVPIWKGALRMGKWRGESTRETLLSDGGE